MQRRTFLKGVGALGASMWLPSNLSSSVDIGSVGFNRSIYEAYNAQTIIVFLYGGPSELAGNLSNIEQIDAMSQNPYPLDSRFTVTSRGFWQEAGGDLMENMIDTGDLNLFRTCYRTVDNLKAHGECTAQAQRGIASDSGAGVIANIAAVLNANGLLAPQESELGTTLPFVTMEGESTYFYEDDLNLESYLKPVAIGSSNPYSRNLLWTERQIRSYGTDHNVTWNETLEALAASVNPEGALKRAFDRREGLEAYMEEIENFELPEGVAYPSNNTFASNLKNAVGLLVNNPHTKMISVGSPGLGGWDDHSDAVASYTDRMTDLMEALQSARDHINASGKTNINIVVYGEFGRNVNYNDSAGWDHGNNQCVYWLGGRDYFNNLGVVGTTEVVGSGQNNRLYTQPTADSYHFQTFGIAATLYKLYGITNPEILTGDNYPIEAGLFRA